MIREMLGQYIPARQDKGAVARMKTLLKTWHDLSVERNYVIHGEWVKDTTGDQAPILCRFAAAKRMMNWGEKEYRKGRMYTPADLENLFQKMQSFTNEMNELLGPIEHRKFQARMKMSPSPDRLP